MVTVNTSNLPTVAEFVSLLDLHDIKALKEAMSAITDTANPDSDPASKRRGACILAELQAKHFPQLVQSICDTKNTMTRFLGFSFLIGGNGPVYLERYTIRDREGSIRLFEAVLEVATVLILAGVDSAQGRVDDEEQLRIHLMSEVFSLLQLFAAAINPARTNVPFSSPETSRLREALKDLDYLVAHPPSTAENLPEILEGLPLRGVSWLQLFLLPEHFDTAISALEEITKLWAPLKSCQAVWDGQSSTACAPVIGSRTNLKACSKCKMVPYCGPDHQREHWTAHKPVCFASTW